MMPQMNERSGTSGMRRRAILVAGMHRSGTSALTRMVNLLGAALPEDLLPASRGNELGHWEPAKIVELHDKMLESAHSGWDNVFGVAQDWFSSAEAAEYTSQIAGFVQQQFTATPLFVIKDPRLALFVPVWVDALKRLDVEPLFVLPFRHPIEVAASILRRQSYFEPDSSWPLGRGCLLWLRCVLDAERTTRGLPRAFVHFDALFEDWEREAARIGSQLDLAWPNQDDATKAEIGRFLNSEHKHERASDAAFGESGIDPLVKEVFAQLFACIADPGAGREVFDSAAATLDKASALFASYVVDLEAKKAAIIDRERVAAETRRVEGDAMRRVDDARLSELEQHNAALLEANARLGRDLAAREADIASLYRSTSWRVSAPLRVLKGLVRPGSH
jgi:hypothetical protein